MDPKELKKLTAVWRKKLKQSGFVDAENANGQLNSYDSFRFNHERTGWDFEAKAEYFRRCEQFLNNYEFKTKQDLKIWTMHSEAISARKISLAMRLGRAKVLEILKRLDTEMKKWFRLEALSDGF